MLADDLATNSWLPRLYVGLDKIQLKIDAAQKFNLATDFALAADGLVDNFHELEKIAPFCRLPYPMCWFEFAQADRHHWRGAPLHYPQLQGKPHRVGFLTEAIGDDLAHWCTYLCWSLKDHGPVPDAFREMAQSNLNLSPLTVSYNTAKPFRKGNFGECIEFGRASFDLGLPKDMIETYFRTLGRSDWAGEIRYLIAILGLLNARNVAELEPVQFTKLNKHRVKQKRQPLSAHTLLKIRSTHKPSLLTGAAGHIRSGEIRAHFVRGHFKTRSTGIFWWGPHMRGQLEHGFVAKDYEVL